MENENLGVSKKKNMKNYLKKYGYYIALALLVVFLAIAIIVTSTLSEDPKEKTVPTCTIGYMLSQHFSCMKLMKISHIVV